MYAEYLSIDRKTHKVEIRELTEVMAANLSEVATVISVDALGGKATVWRDRQPSVIAVDGSTLMELKHRAIWRDKRNGPLS